MTEKRITKRTLRDVQNEIRIKGERQRCLKREIDEIEFELLNLYELEDHLFMTEDGVEVETV